MIRQHLEYIIALAEEKSITRAAERLGITQSALSQYLLSLEKSLQIPLFNRVRNDIAMTHAGSIYLAAARDILKIQKDLASQIEDLSASGKGEISFGIETELGSYVLPRLLPSFSAAFPCVALHVKQETGQLLEELAQMGSLDLVLFSLYARETTLESVHIAQDELLLAVPDGHPLVDLISRTSEYDNDGRYDRYRSAKWPVIDPCLLRKAPIVVSTPNVLARKVADSLFQAADIQPRIVFESDSMTTAYDIAFSIGALCLVPESIVRQRDPHRHHVYFSIDRTRYSMQSIVAWRKGAYLSRNANALIKILRDIL